MKRLIPALFLALPVALFAQAPAGTQESAMLKKFGLDDVQIAMVFGIQDSTREAMKGDAVQLRLLHNQMENALRLTHPDREAVNGYLSRIAERRADLLKTFVGARLQLRQIIGDEHFRLYARLMAHRLALEGRGGPFQIPDADRGG